MEKLFVHHIVDSLHCNSSGAMPWLENYISYGPRLELLEVMSVCNTDCWRDCYSLEQFVDSLHCISSGAMHGTQGVSVGAILVELEVTSPPTTGLPLGRPDLPWGASGTTGDAVQ